MSSSSKNDDDTYICNIRFDTVSAVALHIDNEHGIVSHVSTWRYISEIWQMRNMFEDHIVVSQDGIQSLNSWFEKENLKPKPRSVNTGTLELKPENISKKPVLLVPKVSSIGNTYSWDRMCRMPGVGLFVNVTNISKKNVVYPQQKINTNVENILHHMNSLLGCWLSKSSNVFDIIITGWHMFVEKWHPELELGRFDINQWSQLMFHVDLEKSTKENDYDEKPTCLPAVLDKPWSLIELGSFGKDNNEKSTGTSKKRIHTSAQSSSLQRYAIIRSMSSSSLHSKSENATESNRVSKKHKSVSSDTLPKPLMHIDGFDHSDASHVIAIFPRLSSEFNSDSDIENQNEDNIVTQILHRVSIITKTMVFVDAAERIIAHAYLKLYSEKSSNNTQGSETPQHKSSEKEMTLQMKNLKSSFGVVSFRTCVFDQKLPPGSQNIRTRPNEHHNIILANIARLCEHSAIHAYHRWFLIMYTAILIPPLLLYDGQIPGNL